MPPCPGSRSVHWCEMRILITGATGCIGGRLCEVMALNGIGRPRAFIHSTAAVARIARLPLEFVMGDLCERGSVARAVQECDAVVHLARGEPRVMRRGLENLLRAAVDTRVKRFIHMSSVAVHGDDPRPETISESAAVRGCNTEYGREKLRQERLIESYARRYGLQTVILRPPTVYGPFSSFTLGLLQRIRAGTMAVVNDGVRVCNLVYVDNLVQAVLLALGKPQALGQVFFVADTEKVTWERCLEDHARWAGAELPRIREADLEQPPRENLLLDSLRLLPGVLTSAQFRSVVRQVPLIRAVEQPLSRAFQSLPADAQHWIRRRLTASGNGVVTAPAPGRFSARDIFLAAQSRAVVYSAEKARRLLGYNAPVRYEEGMQLTGAWLRHARAI